MEAAGIAAQPSIDMRVVQGNVVGFNKDFQRFVPLAFADAENARLFLVEIEPDLANAWEVVAFNKLHKEIHKRRHGATKIVQAAWTNLALSFAGLQLISAAGTDSFPDEFKNGMRQRGTAVGDKGESAPQSWVAPFDGQQPVHALVILAADTLEGLQEVQQRLTEKCARHAVTELVHFDGNTRPDPNRGREHFGFKDGISQPSISGLTSSSKPGSGTIAAGEFLIGYPDQDGHMSGQPPTQPPPQPGETGYNPIQPPPPQQPLPDWAHNGSFLVFRRLRQDVHAFNDFVAQQSGQANTTPDQLSAKLVGRWKSGAPLERVPGEPHAIDPTAADPSEGHPSVVDDRHINNFGFEPNDADGRFTPRAAHIRKTNPRNEQPPGEQESNRHRILRRGIPYGPEFQPGEPPYPGSAPVPDTQDRGLLFVCYQSSIARGFEFVQAAWANTPGFPRDGDGRDPIISQDVDPRDFNLTPQNLHLTMRPWVITTGGEYFFAPSLAAIREVLGGAAPSLTRQA
jgi:Dyp-type peroxidase family